MCKGGQAVGWAGGRKFVRLYLSKCNVYEVDIW